MESELFGHVKGSFTGAIGDNPGLFRSAEGGTLFLDEIADLPLAMQVKLLRVLQEKSIRPVGAQQEIATDVRIISASHENLAALVEQGQFRQDLYYRINVIGIQTPSLQARREDIPLLAEHILGRLCAEQQRQLSLDDQALKALQGHDFPGNVRELENVLERAAALAEGDCIHAGDLQLPQRGAIPGNRPSLTQQTRALEAEALRQALEANRWNQSAAARELGITLRQLRYRCEKFGLTKG
jgi:two-component system response regulator PilR (NtrC family)